MNKFTLLFGIWITVWCILYNLTQVFLYTNSPLQWVTIILRGKFATVYQCEKHSNKELFAAKIIQTKSPKNMEESLNEVRRFQSNHDLILLIRNLKKIYRLTRLVSGLRNYYIFIFRDMSWQSKYMMVFKHISLLCIYSGWNSEICEPHWDREMLRRFSEQEFPNDDSRIVSVLVYSLNPTKSNSVKLAMPLRTML